MINAGNLELNTIGQSSTVLFCIKIIYWRRFRPFSMVRSDCQTRINLLRAVLYLSNYQGRKFIIKIRIKEVHKISQVWRAYPSLLEVIKIILKTKINRNRGSCSKESALLIQVWVARSKCHIKAHYQEQFSVVNNHKQAGYLLFVWIRPKGKILGKKWSKYKPDKSFIFFMFIIKRYLFVIINDKDNL